MNIETKQYIETLVNTTVDDLELFISHICHYTLILCNKLWIRNYPELSLYTYGELYLAVLIICTKFNIAHDYEEFIFNIHYLEFINKIDKYRLKEMELIILRIVNWYPFNIKCMYA